VGREAGAHRLERRELVAVEEEIDGAARSKARNGAREEAPDEAAAERRDAPRHTVHQRPLEGLDALDHVLEDDQETGVGAGRERRVERDRVPGASLTFQEIGDAVVEMLLGRVVADLLADVVAAGLRRLGLPERAARAGSAGS